MFYFQYEMWGTDRSLTKNLYFIIFHVYKWLCVEMLRGICELIPQLYCLGEFVILWLWCFIYW